MYEEFQNTHFYLVSLFFEKYLEKSVKLNVIILQFSLFLKRPGYFYFVLYVTRVIWDKWQMLKKYVLHEWMNEWEEV